MQASLEILPGLARKLTIIVPAAVVTEAEDKRLKEIAPTVKIEGFRPGKVPMPVLRKRFGDSIRYDALEKIIDSSYREAIKQEKLAPAGMPKIEITSDKTDEPLEYQAIVEVYPEFKPKGLASEEFENVILDITPADVDYALEKLRHQKAKWVEVDRPSQKGDKVIVSFEGRLDGELFDGGAGENVALELGSGAAIPGFEEGFTNHKAGDEINMDLTFPVDYHAKDLAGKSVAFKGTLNKVQAAELPDVEDSAFLKQFGVEEGGVEKLRQDLLARLQTETKHTIEERLRSQLFKKLIALNPIDLPTALVEQEAKRLTEQRKAYFDKLGIKTPLAEADESILEQAREGVHLGLLMSEISREAKLTPDPQHVEQLLEKVATTYPGVDAAAVKTAYRENPQLYQQLESKALEEMLIEKLMAEATLVNKNMSYQEFIKM